MIKKIFSLICRLFSRTPSVEQFRSIIIRSLKTKNIEIPKDVNVLEEINGFQYRISWESIVEQMKYIVWCMDIRSKNEPIQVVVKGLS